MNIKVRDLKQTDKIENENKLMVLVDDDLNLVKNITKEEFLTNVISTAENNALVQETDGNLYVNTSELADSITALDNKFTSEIGNLDELTTEDKNNLVSAINEAAQSGGGSGLSLFTPVRQDHILTYKETKGLALQGTYVYKTGIAGERYGYPSFIQKCIDEKTAGTAKQVTLGSNTITMYVNANGHKFYDIADKAAVDAWFNTTGIAWYYGIDTANERVFLPRNIRYSKNGTVDNVGTMQYAGLPSINHSHNIYLNADISHETRDANLNNADTVGGTNITSPAAVTTTYNMTAVNPIYGKSNTVDLDSTNFLIYIVVGNTSEVTNITTTIPSDEIISQVNKNTTDIIELNENKAGMPDWSRTITNLGLPTNPTSGSSSVKYTTPTDGYIHLQAERNGNGTTLQLFTSGVGTPILLANAPAFVASFLNVFIPVSKGEKLFIGTDNTTITWTVTKQNFIPMKGAN